MTELKILTEVQRFEASGGLALQTQVAATVIRMLSEALSKFKGFPSFVFFLFFSRLLSHKLPSPHRTLTTLSRVMKSWS